jgi:glycosyltransferase involved in cell wall biosynthesis
MCIVASRYETFPNTALEAMACGCPVVSTAVGGVAELIEDGHNGMLCRPEDAEDLAQKILTLRGNRPLAAQLGEQAARDTRERFGPEVIARRTLEFYGQVLERAGRKRRCGVSGARQP